VILVHGTFEDMSDNWQALSPRLVNNGYCVFALNYGSFGGSGQVGIYATGEIAHSAEELCAFVDQVLAATHARKVDLVGHSQGGMMPRYYLRFLGGAAKVHTLVGLGCTVGGSVPVPSRLAICSSATGMLATWATASSMPPC
jgi:triacylglycerol esterase/lipase EstA (alpha/beta hydrolase family)